MKAIASALLSTLLLISSNSFANENYTEAPENFIKLVASKEFQAAIDSLYPGKSYWATPQGLAEKSNISTKLEKLGDYRFHKLLSEKGIGERYVTLSYIVGFQEKPLFMTLVMYKPQETWEARNFNFSDNLSELKNFSSE